MCSICGYRNNTYKCIAKGMILICLYLLYLLIFSCSDGNRSNTKNDMLQQKATDTEITIDSLSEQELHDTQSLQELYIYPNPLEHFISPSPELLSSLFDRDKALKNFQKESKIVPSDEFKRYLERKRQFIKSSIFADIP